MLSTLRYESFAVTRSCTIDITVIRRYPIVNMKIVNLN